jgi:tetratricopeptide (TPR) repeat protein
VSATAEVPTPDLTLEQSQLLADVAGRVVDGTSRLHIASRPGFGQTTWLERLAATLGESAVLMAPPPGSEDTAVAALVQLVDGLHRVSALNGGRGQVADAAVSFTDKVTLVAEAIANCGDGIVLLVDEPVRWAANASEHAAPRIEELLRGVLHAARKQVVVGYNLPPVVASALYEEIPLSPGRFPPELLLEYPWDELAPHATEVAGWLREGFQVSPVVFRALVASSALAAQGVGAAAKTTSRLQLAKWLWDQVSEPSARPVRDAWRALAVLRAPVPEAVALRVLEPLDLAEFQRAVVWRCLVAHEVDDTVRMPQVLRSTATDLSVGSDTRVRGAHETLAAYYAEVLEGSASEHLMPRHERAMHLGLAGDVEGLLSEQPMFREQLHAVGWWLSRRLGRHEDAARVFERAVDLDETDSYAQHYLAYNLDLLGTRPDDVENSYRTAAKLRPESYWHWSRLVRFLIARQRIDDARETWDEALSFLEDTEQPPDADVYADLHVEVARWLLHALELDFAERVLADIPGWARTRDADALVERLQRLRVVRELQQEIYVPLWALSPQWASEGPFALPSTLDDLPPREWWAARIDRIEGNEALLSAAAVVPGEPPEVEEMVMRVSVAELVRLSRQPQSVRRGAMLEAAWYPTAGGDEVRAVRFHPPHDPEGSRLPPLFPDPLRYVRRR